MNFLNKKHVALFLIISIAIAGVLLVLTRKSVTEEEIKKPPQETTNQGGEAVNSNSTQAPIQATTTLGTTTYRNEEWGFEFEYPEGWEIIENPYGSPFSKFNLIIVPIEGKYLPDPVLVNITTLDFADRAAISRKKLGAIESNITIGDTEGVKYQYTEQFSIISLDIPFGEYRMILGAKKQYEDIFNKILTSFKFFEPSRPSQ